MEQQHIHSVLYFRDGIRAELMKDWWKLNQENNLTQLVVHFKSAAEDCKRLQAMSTFKMNYASAAPPHLHDD